MLARRAGRDHGVPQQSSMSALLKTLLHAVQRLSTQGRGGQDGRGNICPCLEPFYTVAIGGGRGKGGATSACVEGKATPKSVLFILAPTKIIKLHVLPGSGGRHLYPTSSPKYKAI